MKDLTVETGLNLDDKFHITEIQQKHKDLSLCDLRKRKMILKKFNNKYRLPWTFK
jgi:hypothetical protein